MTLELVYEPRSVMELEDAAGLAARALDRRITRLRNFGFFDTQEQISWRPEAHETAES